MSGVMSGGKVDPVVSGSETKNEHDAPLTKDSGKNSSSSKKALIVGLVAFFAVLVCGGAGVAIWLLKFGGLSNNNSYSMPVLKPSVLASTPEGLLPQTSRRRRSDRRRNENVMIEELQGRLFSGAGPTSLYELLDDVDSRINSLNRRAKESEEAIPCMSSEPIAVPITGWPGESDLQIWVQCFEQLSATSFLMWGVLNGTYYLADIGAVARSIAFIHTETESATNEAPCCYQVNGGGSRCMCVTQTMTCWLTGSGGTPYIEEGGNCRTTPSSWNSSSATNTVPANIPNSSLADVNLYFSIGANYLPSESGSIGNVHVVSSPGRNNLQATLGGIGLGFCGLQFTSAGDVLYAHGSPDGVGSTCRDVESVCMSADLTTEYALSECSDLGFNIFPLGRQSSDDHLGPGGTPWNPCPQLSGFEPSVDINYTATNNGNTIKFGPDSIPTSVSADPLRNFFQP